MQTYYRPDSARVGSTYAGRVHEHRLIATETDESGQWSVQLPFGSALVTSADGEDEALEAGRAHLARDGWTLSRAVAQAEADAQAARRRGPLAAKLRKLRGQHKDRLHVILIGQGHEARARVQRWILGVEPVPADVAARL